MNNTQHVLVAGGCGYMGSVLVRDLLAAGHTVTVYDSLLFGNHLQRNDRLRVFEGDVRDAERLAFCVQNQDAVIHLACISNDPSAELDASLTRAVNLDSFEPCVKACKAAGVGRFVFASSSSVYGVSDSPNVTEEHPLNPITDYSRFKAECEGILRQYQSADFTTVVVRPATICGVSPRQRFDLVVNILTNHAVRRNSITVFGDGSQKRPSVHIDDLSDLYCRLLTLPVSLIAGQTFNAGRENRTVLELAHIVKDVVEHETGNPVTISCVGETSDPRSYHVSSAKAAVRLGWHPYRTVADAVRDICRAFKAGVWADSFADEYVNVKVMKQRQPLHQDPATSP